MKIINIVGARPNFMKIAPLMEEYSKYDNIEPLLIHTGQHYDEKMSDLFFRQLGIPEPNLNLGIGSGTHAVQTAEIMKAFEPICMDYQPDAVLVVGDVNSTIACGLVAVKLGIKLIHVEAGLRSGDRTMPEEINRILTDSISDLLFCTEQSGIDNLISEGVHKDKMFLVGHVMIDTLKKNIDKAQESDIDSKLQSDFNLDINSSFALLTMHRPSNVDCEDTLRRILDALEYIQVDMPIVFPVHPRTRNNLIKLGLDERIKSLKNLHLLDPIGYLDFLKLTSMAKIVLTDSGGIQEETTVLGIPCITLRENTERPVTVELGTNHLVGTNTSDILNAYKQIKNDKCKDYQIPPLWDGKAAERIVKIIMGNIH